MRSTLAVLVTSVLGMGLLASSASAQRGTVDIIGSAGSGAGELAAGTTGVAVNNATGHIYVGDNANHRVVEFDASGDFARTWGRDVDATNPSTGFEVCTASSGNVCKVGDVGEGSGQFGPYAAMGGIGVNQDTGNVYVHELQPVFRIQVFSASGTFIRMWGWDVNDSNPSVTFENCTAASGDVCQAGTGGSGLGQFSAASVSRPMPLAIDPTNGDVVVADAGNRRAQRFSANGAFIGTIGSQAQFDAENAPSGITVDSKGSVYANLNVAPSGDVTPGGPVHRFDATGSYLGIFTPILTQNVAASPITDRVYTTRFDENSDKWKIAEYGPTGNLLDELATGLPAPSGLAVNPLTGSFYVSDEQDGRILVIDDVPNPPTASSDVPTEVTSNSATLSGSVNPNGSSFSTSYHFEYRPSYSTKWLQVSNDVNIGNGVDAVQVSASLADLDPNTKYHVRLVATRELGAGSSISPEATFQTEPVAPEASLVGASRVTDTTARLGASIDPRRSTTTYYFKYGTDTSYGSLAPLGQDGLAGDTLGKRAVFEQLSELAPNTTYHFCVVAENTAGATACEDQTFTTTTIAEQVWPQRKLELINEPDKGNQNATRQGSHDTFVAADGERVVWQTSAGTPTSSSGAYAFFVSSRTPNGWNTEPFAPTPDQQPQDGYAGDLSYAFAGANPSLTEFLISGTEGFFAGGVPNYLIRASSPESQEVLTFRGDKPNSFFGSPAYVQASLDLSDVVVLDPDTNQLVHYGRGSSQPLASPTCGVQGFASEKTRSSSVGEGNVLVLSSGDSDCGAPLELYSIDLATNAATLISAAATGPQLGVRIVNGVAEDGSAAIFETSSALAASDGNDESDLYKWSEESSLSCLTCGIPAYAQAAGATETADASADLSRVYFRSGMAIDGAPPEPNCMKLSSPCNLYVLRVASDEVHFIGQMGRGSSIGGEGHELKSTMTPNGEVYVFHNSMPGMTADEMGIDTRERASTQLYRYDDAAEIVECVSCRAGAGPNHGSLANNCCPAGAVAIANDGDTVAFSTSTAIVRADINSNQDIYEWHNGVVRLVTDGARQWSMNAMGGAPQVWGISEDGTDLIVGLGGFRLTGEESDFYMNAYDARVGGGFPSIAPISRCTEDACQGPLQPSPQLNFQGSSAFAGPGTSKTRRAQRKTRRQKRKASAGKRKSKRQAVRAGHGRGGKG